MEPPRNNPAESMILKARSWFIFIKTHIDPHFVVYPWLNNSAEPPIHNERQFPMTLNNFISTLREHVLEKDNFSKHMQKPALVQKETLKKVLLSREIVLCTTSIKIQKIDASPRL